MHSKKFLKKTTTACALGALLLLASPASALAVLSETFVAGERLVQDLPNTSAWYGSTATSLTQPGAGIITSITGQTLLTYFTDSGTVALGVGEEMTVSFDFQMANPQARTLGVRAAVLNSTTGGGRIGADNFGSSNALFAGYTGYAGIFNPGGASMTLRERTGSGSGLVNIAGEWTTRNTNNTAVNIAANTTYNGVFLVSRTAESVIATFSVSGPGISSPVTVSFNDTGSSLFEFDTFAIWTNSDIPETFSLTGVDVAVIPEPSTWALFAGLAVLGALVIHRRRRF